MTREDYNEDIAYHYAAYRPPLHRRILHQALPLPHLFNRALDIGCGTGRSSLALTVFAETIVGIDPSYDMLAKAVKHEKITYQYYNKARLDFPEQHFDLITLAGVLFYAKSPQLLAEILSVAQPKASLLIYDFEVVLDEIYAQLNLSKPQSEIVYRHDDDFSDLINDSDNIELTSKKNTTISFSLTTSELAHLVLSSPDIYIQLNPINEADSLYEFIKSKLYAMKIEKLQAIIYYTHYRLNI